MTAAAVGGIPWVRFTEPQAPAGFVLTVEARDGACAVPGGDLRVLSSGSVRPGIHDAIPDSSPPGSGAARCYRVVVHDGSYPSLAPAFVASVTYQAA